MNENLKKGIKYAITGFVAIFVPLLGIIGGSSYFGVNVLKDMGITGLVLLALACAVASLISSLYRVALLKPAADPIEIEKLREEIEELVEQVQELKKRNLQLEEDAALVRHQKEPRRRHTSSIGIVAPIVRFPTTYYLETIRGIRDAVKNAARLVLFDLNKEQIGDVKFFFKAKNFVNLVDGLITINLDIPPSDMKVLANLRFPVVSIYNDDTDPPVVGCINPGLEGLRELIEHLIKKHNTQFFYLVTRPLSNPMKFSQVDPFRKIKRDVFYNVLQTNKIHIDQSEDVWNLNSLQQHFSGDRSGVIETRDYSLEAGRELFMCLERKLRPNSALICLADALAAGFLQAAAEADFDIQGIKLRITGFDNSYLAHFYDISSVDYNLPLTGELAYRRLQAALSNLERGGELIPATEEKVATKFIPRSSCCYGMRRGKGAS
jgi:DNA-binding LacI/PurR family transcriptional regulator